MQEVFTTVLSYSSDLFAYVDKNITYQYVSNSYASFYGLDSTSIRDASLECAFDKRTYEKIILPNLKRCFKTQKPVNFQSWITSKATGEKHYLYVTYLPHVSQVTQKVEGIIFTAKDVSEFKRAEKLLAKTANTDALTNIPNRLYLNNKLEELSRNMNRHSDRYALLFCDLDGFKGVNDKHGHAVGDKVLTQVANRLQQHIRNDDIIARFGGDEFVILITDNFTEETLNTIRDKIFKSISQPFSVSGNKIKVGISIGVAMFPDDGLNGDALLEFADKEMYSSKYSGRISA